MLCYLWSLHIAKWDLVIMNPVHAVLTYPEVLLRNRQVKNQKKRKEKIFNNICVWTKEANLHGPDVYFIK